MVPYQGEENVNTRTAPGSRYEKTECGV
jgi:hypothetical protein